eukprot:XP_014784684.1 PREDICTED: uncharacterized protein LOC106879564 [Octopus bimaculoides]
MGIIFNGLFDDINPSIHFQIYLILSNSICETANSQNSSKHELENRTKYRFWYCASGFRERYHTSYDHPIKFMNFIIQTVLPLYRRIQLLHPLTNGHDGAKP